MSFLNVNEYFVNDAVYIWDVYMSCMELCPLFLILHCGEVGYLLGSGPDTIHVHSICVIATSYLICRIEMGLPHLPLAFYCLSSHKNRDLCLSHATF